MKRTIMLLFGTFFLLAIAGCAKQYPPAWTYNYKFDVTRSGNEFFMNFDGKKYTLLRVNDEYTYTGTQDGAFVFTKDDRVVVVFGRFGTFKEKLSLNDLAKTDPTAHLISVVPYGVNGEYRTAVKNKDYGELVEVAYVHHDLTESGWFNMFFAYGEKLDGKHAFSKWPDSVPDKEEFLTAVKKRAENAVLILPKGEPQ
ncbi:hypothetical protein ACQ0P8_06790 [Halodesulfovibrio aestuarii]|uniref:Lipoprotein n=1 Tax=Halodesulfovibrio aestuarii TaxID=126333 RepID=A0A8G2FJB5_9BACT|nr:hypothetical protein [Halodesulfovibrio aestuarii]SHJ76751.1 hypothetical protein SAMN05660830_03175 [Halodesulfovibrio aestuarii]